jgi:acetoacetyl-CoA synthetase
LPALTEIREGTRLWEPSQSFKERSVIAAYMGWLEEHRQRRFADYAELWQWSVDDLEGFWSSIAEFFDIRFARPYERVLGDRSMPGARWFEGAQINYAENVFRHGVADGPALLYRSETGSAGELSWTELREQVASVARFLRERGVTPGDRVVAYMPNIPETVVAFLAAASLGAIWSSCSPDFGTEAVLDRFAQIEPKILFAVDGYTYGGKRFDRLPIVRELHKGLPTLRQTVLVRTGGEESLTLPGSSSWTDAASRRGEALAFERVAFDHPLWVVYSSGTTGLPKALVHGHGGVVLEHVKALGLHCNLRPGDRLFWFTSTGWMMWNFIVGGLLVGAPPVLYDGNPGFPDLDVLWRLAQDVRATLFGTSAAYLMTCLKNGLTPGQRFDLSSIECIASTGSPLPPEGFAWVYQAIRRDIWLSSLSGGTDVVSAFVMGCPLLPVHAGELQCRGLGAKVEAFDEDAGPVLNKTGELVITEPLPSMPVFLWNDQDGSRYRASYYEMYPGVWRHGDWIKITDRGSAVIQGRSDSMLNRLGVRIGSSEIYTAVESLPEVRDSLVVGLELPNGGYYMPLFVVLEEGVVLDEAAKQRINTTIRSSFSPRHVPDEIVVVPAIPRTLSDKKMEVPIKRLFQGVPVEKVANVGATRNPEALGYFAQLARRTSPLLKKSTAPQ